MCAETQILNISSSYILQSPSQSPKQSNVNTRAKPFLVISVPLRTKYQRCGFLMVLILLFMHKYESRRLRPNNINTFYLKQN